MKYKCSQCGQVHEEWPALTFNSPYHYDCLSEEDKTRISELSDDFCTIKYDDQTDRFIRVILKQKVIDHCQDLEYGLWVSLSEKSFNEYSSNFKKQMVSETYFGFLCSQLSEYEDTIGIKTNVVTGEDDNRPEIFPHDDQMDNKFVRDYYKGISKKEAEKRIKSAIEGK